MSNALETTGLGKRYGRIWALQDCTLSLSAGCVAALVGPNGAADDAAGADKRPAL